MCSESDSVSASARGSFFCSKLSLRSRESPLYSAQKTPQPDRAEVGSPSEHRRTPSRGPALSQRVASRNIENASYQCLPVSSSLAPQRPRLAIVHSGCRRTACLRKDGQTSAQIMVELSIQISSNGVSTLVM
ncbi:hypothetical protein BDV98DRAFT_108037 [Pterulicium gracile]|uniref:Uncharacterized protein n=1 Tax=Pterulicium gracile TaxID=1884261 RepID=A0A5C3QG01_9AGAR|nr:hypothetical protein BDV98DRAFT_108037 [Pterula gracilis]